jgi:hypothetical protein
MKRVKENLLKTVGELAKPLGISPVFVKRMKYSAPLCLPRRRPEIARVPLRLTPNEIRTNGKFFPQTGKSQRKLRYALETKAKRLDAQMTLW